MDFLTNIWNYIKTAIFGESKPAQATETAKKKNTIFPPSKKQVYKNEIGITGSKTDEQLQTEATRSRYITVTKNKDYKLKSGDTVSKIAKRFGVEERSVLDSNGLTKETAKRLRVGQTIKIPPSRKAKNVKNLNDVAKSLGVSTDFIKKLKRAEDSAKLADNRFHNTPYTDEAGVKTIGVGHVLKKGEPQKQLSKEFVRQWLIEHNFMGRQGDVMPEMTDEYIDSVSARYIELYEHIVGEKFVKAADDDLYARIEKNVSSYLESL